MNIHTIIANIQPAQDLVVQAKANLQAQLQALALACPHKIGSVMEPDGKRLFSTIRITEITATRVMGRWFWLINGKVLVDGKPNGLNSGCVIPCIET